MKVVIDTSSTSEPYYVIWRASEGIGADTVRQLIEDTKEPKEGYEHVKTLIGYELDRTTVTSYFVPIGMCCPTKW